MKTSRSRPKTPTPWPAASARECGLLLGVSAAAGIAGSLRVAEHLQLRESSKPVIVTILCDSGDKYLSERFWTEG